MTDEISPMPANGDGSQITPQKISMASATQIAALVSRRVQLQGFVSILETDTKSMQPWAMMGQQGQIVCQLDIFDAAAARQGAVLGAKTQLSGVEAELEKLNVSLDEGK